MPKSDLYDYIDAYILVKWTIIITPVPPPAVKIIVVRK